jgi:thiamine pyrophosphokinase
MSAEAGRGGSTKGSRILIFANGALPDAARARALVRADDFIVCADGGTRHALDLGLTPQAIIGDLDSLTEAERAHVAGADVILRQYPHDKDETDLELALGYCLEQNPSSVLIVGALGRRLDHTLGNVALLTDARLAALDCRLDDGLEEALLCHGRSEVFGRRDDVVSLIPWGAPVFGVRTEGLRWPLKGETLYPDKTRGLSNEMLSEAALVRLESGPLLIIHSRRT